MVIVPNTFFREITERYYPFIYKFIESNLNENAIKHFSNLEISIDLVKEIEDNPPGQFSMDRNYLHPHISLGCMGLKHEYRDFWRSKGGSLREIYLLVLFHELAHIVLVLNYLDFYEEWLADDTSLCDPEIERNCNYLAEKFLRDNQLISTDRPACFYEEF